jgi:hypothetical protein
VKTTMNDQALPEYRTPEIQTLREEELLRTIGPAHAYTGSVPFGF